MKKSDKKTEKSLIATLTQACEIAKQKYDGFEWLTHFVNYSSFPSSLSIICIFDTNKQLDEADVQGLQELIKAHLASISINIKNIAKQVSFDTEENCALEHNGNWNKRFKHH